MGKNRMEAFSDGVLLMTAVAYTILVQAIIAADDGESLVARAIGRDIKGYASIVLYALAIPLAFVGHWIAQGLYVLVALLWLVPDRRIEKRMTG